MVYETGEQVGMYTQGDASALAATEAAQGTAAESSGTPVLSIEQQAVTLGSAGNLPATIDITDPSGEVVQRLLIPQDLHLEPGQTLVLIQDEDGQPQLAVINQAGECHILATDIIHLHFPWLYWNWNKLAIVQNANLPSH